MSMLSIYDALTIAYVYVRQTKQYHKYQKYQKYVHSYICTHVYIYNEKEVCGLVFAMFVVSTTTIGIL